MYEKLLRGPLLASRTVILVTHHVDLVLPGAHYLVRMLDGRIDTQGTVADLRAQGVLDDITHEAEAEAHKEEKAVAAEESPAAADETVKDPTDQAKKPRKLVEDEKREHGGVKWRIYKKYLEASYVTCFSLFCPLIVHQLLLGLGSSCYLCGLESVAGSWGKVLDQGILCLHVYSENQFLSNA